MPGRDVCVHRQPNLQKLRVGRATTQVRCSFGINHVLDCAVRRVQEVQFTEEDVAKGSRVLHEARVVER